MQNKTHTTVAPPAETARGEAGFTLVEVVVAMVLAVVVLTGLTLTMGTALKASRDNRIQRQATVLALEHLEFARSVSWGELATSEPVLGWDPRILHPADKEVLGSAMDLPSDETIVSDFSNGLIETYTDTTLDGITFDVSTYVTQPEPSVRRVIVFVDWTTNGVAHEHFTMALVSELGAP